MNRKITCIVCFAVMLLSACTEHDVGIRPYVVAEFENSIDRFVMFQAEDRVYVTTQRSSGDDLVTDVYRVDLRNGDKTVIFSTKGFSENFIVSADEKFIAIGVYVGSPTDASTYRLELFDLTTGTKTVVKTIQSFIIPLSFDLENKALLYTIYENNVGNSIRKIDLVSGADVILSEAPSGIVIAVQPITWNILMQSSGGSYFFMDWDGNVVGEPITGFDPQFFSPDGEEIIGSRGFIWDGNTNYLEVVRFKIATGEVESLTGTETQGEFIAASVSPDQNFVLGLTNDSHDQFLDDLYVVNTVTLERNKLMSTRDREQAIAFFDAGRKVLFVAPSKNDKVLYGIRVD